MQENKDPRKVTRKGKRLEQMEEKKVKDSAIAESTSTVTAHAEEVMELRALVESLEGRLLLTEQKLNELSLPAQSPTKEGGVRREQVAPLQSMVGQEPSQDVVDRYQELQRNREKNKTVKVAREVETSRILQVAREIEGQNLGAARTRLDSMKVKGTISSYMILNPGATSPLDFVPDRLKITVDAYQVIISADVG